MKKGTLTIADIIDWLDDKIICSVSAYNIPLYNGYIEDLPAIYCNYAITSKLAIRNGVLYITLDC